MTDRKWPERNLWVWAQFPNDWRITLNSWIGTTQSAAENQILYARYLVWQRMLGIQEDSGGDLEDLKLALKGAASAKSRTHEMLRQNVATVMSHGYSWTDIAIHLGKSRKTVWKRFHGVEHSPTPDNFDAGPDAPEDDESGPNPSWITDGQEVSENVGVVLRDLVVQAKCDTWKWGYPYSRAKGMSWAEVAATLGKSISATHAKYRDGLSIERYHQLNEELEWEHSIVAGDSELDAWFRFLMRMRRQVSSGPGHTR
ncbi:hypothetical protein [Streptomyces lydicus]|uniref:hypothetical protein n=1 Tax=Streptomyces lydicus TaxID=47763 RepID=UPI00287041C3|nr:hypothetical protein [Streptomyces lydicus]